MANPRSTYGPYVLILGIALPIASYLFGLVFGIDWPPLTLGSLALSVAVGFTHAAYFVPVYFVITTRPETTRDRFVLAATWGFLGLMMAVAPLQDTIRYGVDGLRFELPLIAVQVTAFILIGVVQGRMLSRDSDRTGRSASTPDVV